MRAGKFVLQAIALMAVLVCAQAAALTKLVQHIDQGRDGRNLSSAIRLFVFNHLRAQIAGTKVRLIEEVKFMDRGSADDHAQ
jgi:predicted DNA-binding ribbon-helix-helix protein